VDIFIIPENFLKYCITRFNTSSLDFAG